MFDAQRLLGGLVSTAISSSLGVKRSRRKQFRSSSIDQAVGMGLLGLAVGAFEHFMKQGVAQPAGTGGVAPPPAPAGGFSQAVPPPPPSASVETNERTLLLVRAMLSAAQADGVLDDEERGAVLSQVSSLGLGPEAKSFVEGELNRPASLEEIVSLFRLCGGGAELAEQTYTAALVGAGALSDGEGAYLEQLAALVGLPQRRIEELHATFERA